MMIPKYGFEHDLRVYNLGDVHRANANCDVELLHQVIAEINDNPNAYWVSTGDLLEVAIRHSKGDCHSAQSLDSEFDALKKELGPITHKCLGMVESNHHRRVAKETGLNLDKRFAYELNIPYLGKMSVINTICGRASYFIALHHGIGSGTMGNKINRARILSGLIAGADVYFTGHTHSFSATPEKQRVINRKTGRLMKYVSWHVVTGHFLDYEQSYAEDKMLQPMPKGAAYVDLKYSKIGNWNAKRVVPGFMSEG